MISDILQIFEYLKKSRITPWQLLIMRFVVAYISYAIINFSVTAINDAMVAVGLKPLQAQLGLSPGDALFLLVCSWVFLSVVLWRSFRVGVRNSESSDEKHLKEIHDTNMSAANAVFCIFMAMAVTFFGNYTWFLPVWFSCIGLLTLVIAARLYVTRDKWLHKKE